MKSYVLSMLATQNPSLFDQREVNAELLESAQYSQSTIDRVMLPPVPASQDAAGAQAAAQAAVIQATVQNERQKTAIAGQRAQTEAMKVQADIAAQRAKAQAEVTRAQADAAVKHQQIQTDQTERMARLKLDLQAATNDMQQAALDRASREKIAEINGRVQLLLKGIEALTQVPNDPVNSDLGGNENAGQRNTT
jgi:uncharacterized membrane protein YqiK